MQKPAKFIHTQAKSPATFKYSYLQISCNFVGQAVPPACLPNPHPPARPLEVPPQYQPNILAGIIPPHQPLRQIENLLRIVDPVKVILAGRMCRPIPSIQIDVAPDADV